MMLTSWKRRPLLFFTALFFGFATFLPGLEAQNPPVARAAAKPLSAVAGNEAPLVFWNRTLFVFRSSFEQLSPEQRAAGAQTRLVALPEFGPWNITDTPVTVRSLSGILISVNERPMFGVLPGDLDPEGGETVAQAASQAVARLKAALEARESQQDVPLMLRAAGFAVAATFLFGGMVWLVLRLQKGLSVRLQNIVNKSQRLKIGGVDLRSHAAAFQRAVIRFLTLVALVFLTYVWLMYELMRFPYTQPWGDRLGTFLLDLLQTVVHGVVASLPDLFTVVVILVLTRMITRAVRSFFLGVEEGRIMSISGFHPETARATRRLVVFVIWIFALTVAYPYIPGSNTEGFKGVGALAALAVSLGSAGLVNQVMSGLVIIYSRAFRVNDYVSIGDTEGLVTDLGLLSTKLLTVQKEEIVIPNATLVGMKAVNYTRLVDDQGSVASTSVTIGYDTPWRQVHSMLLLAASRSAGVRQHPPPRVIQRSLSDFYIEYCLMVQLLPLARPEERPVVLSGLHAQIQDVFNEFGVQIMSPHFMMQPPQPVVVPKSDWFAAPASPPSGEQPTHAGVDSRRTGVVL
jgi:small-conductance mechanosensitive channel